MTTRLIETLDDVSDGYDALLCDLWGCYHDGLRPLPAAVAALRRFRAKGGIVLLLTNAPRPAVRVRQFLDGIGAPEDSYDAIMSSGEACQRALASGGIGRRFAYVGPDRDRHMLEDVGLSDTPVGEADAILCTGFENDAAERPEDYDARIALWLGRGLPLVCANPDIVVDRGEERLWCAGAIAERYEQAGGRVVWFGKPHAPTYVQSLARIAEVAGREIPRARLLALGDGIQTDVAGAHGQGIDALFVTGGLAAREVGEDPDRPDPERLRRWLADRGIAPRYAIGRLR